MGSSNFWNLPSRKHVKNLPFVHQSTTAIMSHCHDEHEGHGHGHSHAHGVHDHSDDITPALQNSLYRQIDFDAINTLNESASGSGSKICKKTWDERLNPEPELCSDADEQLLMHIPYAIYHNYPLHDLCANTSMYKVSRLKFACTPS